MAPIIRSAKVIPQPHDRFKTEKVRGLRKSVSKEDVIDDVNDISDEFNKTQMFKISDFVLD